MGEGGGRGAAAAAAAAAVGTVGGEVEGGAGCQLLRHLSASHLSTYAPPSPIPKQYKSHPEP